MQASGGPSRNELVEEFRALWSGTAGAPDVIAFLDEARDATIHEKVDVLVEDIRQRVDGGLPVAIEDYIERLPGIDWQNELRLALVFAECSARQARGEAVDVTGWADRFADIREDIIRGWTDAHGWEGTTPPAGRNDGDPPETQLEPSRQEVVPDAAFSDPFYSVDWAYAEDIVTGPATCPERIGKYRVQRILNQGGFKRVYLAHDEGLDRLVAVKIPHPRIVAETMAIDSFVHDARILAQLEHPGVVPVYDFDRTTDERCYVVEKFIEGESLAQRALDHRFDEEEAAAIVAAVAEALHYVHTQGVIHRDVKPANILLDLENRPVLTDFGLALRPGGFGKKARLAGTIGYMSPEQARNEGHLVDGRSDIFSLGVVFYEILTGTRPFTGETSTEILERIKTLEPRPPRQIDDRISREVERICLKALAKRASDRYNTAWDLADDLRYFLSQTFEDRAGRRGLPGVAGARPNGPAPVVPRGLRPFDAEDSEAFLRLLPGPRDRDGLPASIRFWKTRIEETDPDETFRVGLLYGPSGCGKSSLLKAGILPRLAGDVTVVYVQATEEDTEGDLLRALHKRCPRVGEEAPLGAALASIRNGHAIGAGTKVLLVLDQFEQWLCRHSDPRDATLVEALRQCDGRRLQCILTVRDDFWMAVTRFVRELEIRLVEGENSAPVDLFDARHARAVLAELGRAYGALGNELTKQQESFVSQAIAELAHDGKIVALHVALFAEIVKDRDWSLATLRAMGGAYGVGVAFLEQTFAAPTAPPEYRLHQKAAHAVLEALLPEPGREIKSHSRSRAELLRASGYARRAKDFAELLSVLDNELRLLTPRDPGTSPGEDGNERYQLTHDYLVPSLREWLTKKKSETRQGRAELLLAERYALWHVRRERKQLPSWWEWLTIALGTRARGWQLGPKRMMWAAGTMYATRLLVVVGIVTLLLVGTNYWRIWRIDGWVAAARGHWSAGSASWPDACKEIETARQADPARPSLGTLLGDILSRGRVEIEPPPRATGVDVLPHESDDVQLGLPLEPRVFSREDNVFQLAPGHYRAEIDFDGQKVRFPIFVSQVTYQYNPNPGRGWEQKERLFPEDVTFLRKDTSEPTQSITFADAVHFDIRLPRAWDAEKYAYVPPGPFYRAKVPDMSEAIPINDGQAPFEVVRFSRSALMADVLENGFLIARDETTIAEFRVWYEARKDEYFAWRRKETISSRLGTQWRYLRNVPLDVQVRCWQHLGSGVTEARTVEDLLKVVLREELEATEEAIKSQRDRIETTLDSATDEGLPMTGVEKSLALVYAWTQASVRRLEFEPWLRAAIEETKADLGTLRGVHQRVRALPEADVDPAIIADAAVRDGSDRAPLLQSYIDWFYYEPSYAFQVPSRRVVSWGREHQDTLPAALRRRLDTIEATLETDHQWLRKVDGVEPPHMTLLASYAKAISAGDAPIDREHLATWLERKIDRETDALGRFSLLLRGVGTLEPEDEVPNLDWEVRMRFGKAMGWSLPTYRQWEKAYRGADDRTYPWGHAEDALDRRVHANVAGKDPTDDGPDTIQEVRTSYDGFTGQVHGVFGLAGNVSEWVLGLEGRSYDFFKGGNYLHPLYFTRAGHLAGVEPGSAPPWVGFRVCREIRTSTMISGSEGKDPNEGRGEREGQR